MAGAEIVRLLLWAVPIVKSKYRTSSNRAKPQTLHYYVDLLNNIGSPSSSPHNWGFGVRLLRPPSVWSEVKVERVENILKAAILVRKSPYSNLSLKNFTKGTIPFKLSLWNRSHNHSLLNFLDALKAKNEFQIIENRCYEWIVSYDTTRASMQSPERWFLSGIHTNLSGSLNQPQRFAECQNTRTTHTT